MTKIHLLALGASALALAGCDKGADNNTAPAVNATAAAAVAAPNGGDWTTVVNATPDGGFVMGNPNAPIKLVEYLSTTCPHCAQFATEGFSNLRDQYVKKGTVSIEVRNYVRDPIDMTASLVTRCGGAEPYFPMTEQVMAQQAEMFDKMQKLPEGELRQLQSAPPSAQFKALAAMLGIDSFAKQRGIPQAKLDACFSDQVAIDKLVDMQKKANEMQIPGTPAFFINGTLLENVGAWEQLEPKLKEAGA